MSQQKTFDNFAPFYLNRFWQPFYKRYYKQCRSYVKKYLANRSRVLEIGCGVGHFLNSLFGLNRNLVLFGLDQSQKMLELGRKKHPVFHFNQGAAENLPYANTDFDFVFMIDSFYYFSDKQKAVGEASRVLKPGGYLFIYTPCVDRLFTRFLAWLTKWHYTEQNSSHLPLEKMEKLALQNGLKLVKKKIEGFPNLFCFKYWFLLFQKGL
ncbi:MAG: class I SAM-dependent methyltransferase [Patescibacteria group bacterium]|nr:class I SAM-dependent methyltransferase [Patescibacteria group bacterium]